MKTALVIGGALCVHEDRAAALAIFAAAGLTPDAVVFTNHSGKDEDGPVEHWVTMHSELIPKWLAERRAHKRPEPVNLWCPIGRPVPREMVFRRVPSWGGSSGLLAVTVAMELGCDRIVVCGCPMTRTPHYDSPRDWADAKRYWYAWTKRLDTLRHNVRSVSGWTAHGCGDRGWPGLGLPTVEWLREG